MAPSSRGELLVSKSTLHNNVSTPFAAEAFACLEALNLGISMGMQWVNIMGDSKTTIKKFQTTANKSVIGAIIKDIQNKDCASQRLLFNSFTDLRTLTLTK